MANTLLDQIKIMLKSASYAIFRRIKKLENAIAPPDKQPNKIFETDENGAPKWKDKEFFPPNIYIDYSEIRNGDNKTAKAWKDAKLTEQLSYNEGLKILKQGGSLTNGDDTLFNPVQYISLNTFNKTIKITIVERDASNSDGTVGRFLRCILRFSDSNDYD